MKSEERMLELLADKALFGLSEEEILELGGLSSDNFSNDDESFELAAAAFQVAAIDTAGQVPESLMNKLSMDAAQFFESTPLAESVDEEEMPSTVREVVFEKPAFSLTQWLGWLVAGAACIALAGTIWIGGIGGRTVVQAPAPQVKVPTAFEKRETLLASNSGLVKADWDAPQPDISVSGDVVWDESNQEGYMKLEGLPVNDKSKSTYQLWIFDEGQGDKTPVDGGVFDISKEGEAIVPIEAKIAVKGAKMFAVTVEKPGGVVVSKREKIVALAKIS